MHVYHQSNFPLNQNGTGPVTLKREKHPEKSRTNKKQKSTSDNTCRDVNSLPEEILLKIFSFLTPSSRSDLGALSDLGSLSLVCKKWNRVQEDETLWALSKKNLFGKKWHKRSWCESEKALFKDFFYERIKYHPSFLLKAIGGLRKLSELPSLHLKSIYDLSDSIEKDMYKAPLTFVTCGDDSEWLMIRYVNSEHSLQKIYNPMVFRARSGVHPDYSIKEGWRYARRHDAGSVLPLIIRESRKHLYTVTDPLNFGTDDIGFDGTYHASEFGKNYFIRLIQGKPCGDIIPKEWWEKGDSFKEGKLPEDGSSVVYLA